MHEYTKRLFDLVIFFWGSYAARGEIEFKKGVKPSVIYSDELMEEGCGISSCVPVYINVVPEIDQTFFREEEPGELSLSRPLADQEIVDNSKIAFARASSCNVETVSSHACMWARLLRSGGKLESLRYLANHIKKS